MKHVISVTALILLPLFSFCVTITLGTGGGTNSGTTYPAPYGNWYWGAKHQLLLTASELSSAGMSAGDINSLAFNVQTANGNQLEDYTVGVKHTSATSATSFETGFTTVYGPINYTPSGGWNVHTFSTPFFWDGVQNLLIDVCFNNSSFTSNDIVFNTTTSFTSVAYTFQDASNVCTSPGFVQTSNKRPDIQLDWTEPAIPPTAEFTASTLFTCSGSICFSDLSTNSPTQWLWDFGDGTTDNVQNPCHTYTSNGTYTITLTATNTFGSDSEIKTSFITVNLSAATPAASSCTPSTLTGTLGFGITNVLFNTINNSSGDGSEGYGDFTCQQTTLFAGQSYNLEVVFTGPTTLNGAAWIDYNNDGVLDDVTEKVAVTNGGMSINETVVIPASAVLDLPLRFRVSADYDFLSPPTSCSDLDYGQAEDYTVIIEQDTSPPDAAFTSNILVSCDGVVTFQDLSTNIPIAWLWNFGDGATDVAQNPTHTYAASGTYDVTLIASNAFGNDTEVSVGYITVNLVDVLTSASCTPSTLGYCCDYGIYRVKLNTINNSTPNGEEGYQDYSCEHNTSIEIDLNYSLQVRTGPNVQDTKVWIDYNNDGSFDDVTELVMDAPSQIDPSMMYSPPPGIPLLNTPLRLRVMSDVVGGITDACSDQNFGQTEDYGVTFIDPSSISEDRTSLVHLYPNPANNLLNIKALDGQLIDQLTIIDVTGRIVEQNESSNNSLAKDVSHLISGHYFVVLRVAQDNIVIPFIKL
jgi:PKD repeat protein